MQYEDGNISPLRAFFRTKWVRLVLTIILVVIISIIAVNTFNASRVSTINLDIAPLDATVSINGDAKYTNGVYSVPPGTYQITISHEGFKSKSFSIDIEPRHVATISTFLTNDSDRYDYYELKENYASLQKLIEIASSENNTTTDHDASAENFISSFQKNYELSKKVLPIDYSKYEGETNLVEEININPDYGGDCKKYLCLKATLLFTNDKTHVEKLLKDKGLNLEYFEIKYEMY